MCKHCKHTKKSSHIKYIGVCKEPYCDNISKISIYRFATKPFEQPQSPPLSFLVCCNHMMRPCWFRGGWMVKACLIASFSDPHVLQHLFICTAGQEIHSVILLLATSPSLIRTLWVFSRHTSIHHISVH